MTPVIYTRNIHKNIITHKNTASKIHEKTKQEIYTQKIHEKTTQEIYTQKIHAKTTQEAYTKKNTRENSFS